ncbi:MAG: tRNA pseudouridine(38-40) synthase TruA [Magnetococcales bacterium]|nr:tRNA pseudouridine(38-40) synthase TruA [Magnetococcales bacterium]
MCSARVFPLPRYRLLLEYDGSHFSGWQRQPDQATVQGVLEQQLLPLCGHPVLVVGAGRTDAGVHALGQVAHFDTPHPRDPQVFVRALNATTPEQVTVLKCQEVTDDFHARFSARYREYHYRLHLRPTPSAIQRHRSWHIGRPLDINAMLQAGHSLLGIHDFSAFRAASCQAKSPIRNLYRLEISRHNDELTMIFGANGFLHHQVRNMVGSLLQTGTGRWSAQQFHQVFASRNRNLAAATAPPWGLYLTRVAYEGDSLEPACAFAREPNLTLQR